MNPDDKWAAAWAKEVRRGVGELGRLEAVTELEGAVEPVTRLSAAMAALEALTVTAPPSESTNVRLEREVALRRVVVGKVCAAHGEGRVLSSSQVRVLRWAWEGVTDTVEAQLLAPAAPAGPT
jgi:hypothetical protein